MDALHTENTIKTIRGHYVNVFAPDPETIDILDIAHALSQTPRWGGHATYFYSVAQHSIWMAKKAPLEHKLEALLHDASEAYIGDMPKPIKRFLPEYNAVEKKLDMAIRLKFKLPEKMSPVVKELDKEALEWEWMELKMLHRDKFVEMHLIMNEFMEMYTDIIDRTIGFGD